jgi:cation:H+ antiporter
MLFFWIIVFVISLFVLIKGADWLLASSEKISLAFGLSPFIVGVTVVAAGTSFPELISSLVAVFKGVPEFVVANAVGSNIANTLLIVGICAIVAKRLTVTKDLIDLDLPLLSLATALFFVLAFDGKIEFFESVFLLIAYLIYLGFSLIYKDDLEQEQPPKSKINYRDILILIGGVIGLAIGSKYLIDSVIELSSILNIAPAVIAISAVALGTSAPELIVSIKAAFRRQSEMALGNIFGSNVFNLLAVVGIPGLFSTLIIDEKTFSLGITVLIISTILFVISGISRRIHMQEGAMMLLIYAVFIAKLFNLF